MRGEVKMKASVYMKPMEQELCITAIKNIMRRMEFLLKILNMQMTESIIVCMY